MTQLEELIVDFLVFVSCLLIGTAVVVALIFAVGKTVEHFTL